MNLPALSRLAWRLAGSVLAPVRYNKRANPYSVFRSMPGASAVRGSTPPNKDGKRILVLPIRASSTSNLLEGVIGAGLKLDGHSVYALLDGGSLRYSENATMGKSWLVANALSAYEQHQLCSAFGLTGLYFDDLIDPSELARCKAEIGRADLAQLVSYSYQGIAIGKHARFGLVRYLRQETVDLPENTALLRHFVETALRTALAVRAAVRRERITHAFMSHGIYSTWGTALDVLVAEGVQVSVWGRGYVGGNPIFGRNRSYIAEAIAESADDVRAHLGGREPDRDFLQSYFAAKAKPGSGVDVVSYYDPSQAAGVTAVQSLRTGYKGVVSVFPNIPWDGTMFAASAYTQSLRVFSRKVVLAAESFPDLHFVVRCHPAEKHRDGNNSRESFSSFFTADDRTTPNLTIIEPEGEITSYDLLPVTDAAFVFGTTMGLELIQRGIPVIQTGRNHLVDKGVLFEVGSDDELRQRLGQVRDGELKVTDAMREAFDRYAYYHLKLCHVQDDMIEVNRYRFERYRFEDVRQLAGTSLPSCTAIKNHVLGATPKCLNPYVC